MSFKADRVDFFVLLLWIICCVSGLLYLLSALPGSSIVTALTANLHFTLHSHLGKGKKRSTPILFHLPLLPKCTIKTFQQLQSSTPTSPLNSCMKRCNKISLCLCCNLALPLPHLCQNNRITSPKRQKHWKKYARRFQVWGECVGEVTVHLPF